MLSSEAQLQLRAQHNLLAIFTILRDAAHVGEKQSICLINREVEKMWAHCECRPKKLRHRDLAA